MKNNKLKHLSIDKPIITDKRHHGQLVTSYNYKMSTDLLQLARYLLRIDITLAVQMTPAFTCWFQLTFTNELELNNRY